MIRSSPNDTSLPLKCQTEIHEPERSFTTPMDISWISYCSFHHRFNISFHSFISSNAFIESYVPYSLLTLTPLMTFRRPCGLDVLSFAVLSPSISGFAASRCTTCSAHTILDAYVNMPKSLSPHVHHALYPHILTCPLQLKPLELLILLYLRLTPSRSGLCYLPSAFRTGRQYH